MLPLSARREMRRELQARVRANPRDASARLELAELLESLGHRRQAVAQRVKAAQCEYMDPDFDYGMDAGGRAAAVFSRECVLSPICWGEFVHVAHDFASDDFFPAHLVQAALLASVIDPDAGRLLMTEEYPLLPQEDLRRCFGWGSPCRRPSLGYGEERSVGEEGYSIHLDPEHGMYSLCHPRPGGSS